MGGRGSGGGAGKGGGGGGAAAAPLKKLSPDQARLMSMSDPEGLANAARQGQVPVATAARELRRAATSIDAFANAGGLGEMSAATAARVAPLQAQAAHLRALATSIEGGK